MYSYAGAGSQHLPIMCLQKFESTHQKKLAADAEGAPQQSQQRRVKKIVGSRPSTELSLPS